MMRNKENTFPIHTLFWSPDSGLKLMRKTNISMNGYLLASICFFEDASFIWAEFTVLKYSTILIIQILIALSTNFHQFKFGKLWNLVITRPPYKKVFENLLFFFVCCFTSQVNRYGHGGTVSSPNHFFLGKLEKAVNQ